MDGHEDLAADRVARGQGQRAVEPERYDQRLYAVPEDATEVLLVRHGASAAAIVGESHELLEGRGNPPLSDVGREQAELVGRRLAGEPIRALFCTSLRRTAETAAPLARALGMEPTPVADLAEVGLGEWDGGEFRIRARRGDPLIARVFEEQDWGVLPGAESMAAFTERVTRGIATVAAAGPGLVAAFVHGGVIAELCRQATGSRPLAFVLNDNTAITRLVVHADGSLLLRSFNDRGHLP